MVRTAIVSSAEVLAQDGAPLLAGYWVDRHDGETYPAWQRRVKAEELIAVAERHEQHARDARAKAAEILLPREAR